MDDCISCGKSSLLLTSDQQEHLLLLRKLHDPWTGHSSWTHSSVRESVISSAAWSCFSHTHTHTRTHTHTHTHSLSLSDTHRHPNTAHIHHTDTHPNHPPHRL